MPSAAMQEASERSGSRDRDSETVQVPELRTDLSGLPTRREYAQRSDRLKAIGVMLYVLGISYGGVADALEALGYQASKSSIYRDVQAAGEGVSRIRQHQGKRRVKVLSTDATYVVCNRSEVTIAVALDALGGDVLEVELVDSESADNLRPFLRQMKALFEIAA
jgi:transposase-like protein